MGVTDVALEASGGGTLGLIAYALIDKLFRSRPHNSEIAKTTSEANSIDSNTWRQEAHELFEKVERQCTACEVLLTRYRNAFYDLLDDLNEVDGDDAAVMRAQVRAACRRGRAAIMWEPKPEGGSP